MKPIPPFSLAMTCPAARVCAVTVPGFTGGIARLGGPPGLDPPMATFRARAAGLVSTQLRKKAAQSACLAVAADAVSERSGHGGLLATCRQRREEEEAVLAREVVVEITGFPVPVEDEKALAMCEPAHHGGVRDGVGISVEVAVFDPLVKVLDCLEVGLRDDGGVRLVEHPSVDGLAPSRWLRSYSQPSGTGGGR